MAGKRSEPRERKPLVVTAGVGGWTEVKWRAGQPNEVVAYVRFALEPNLTARAVELRVLDPWVRSHRHLPLGRVESAVNADADLRVELQQAISQDAGPDLPLLFSMKRAIKKGMSPRVKLERPAGRRLDDDFYKQVAEAYRDAVAAGLNPRKTLAADSAIPADTVARWVRTARRRHFLPDALPGKVSA